MRVAAGQFRALTDKAVNRARAVELTRAAAAAGAELVVLPEAAMYPLGGPPEELAAAAEPLDGEFATDLATAAAELGVTVMAGMFEQVPDDRRVYNTVVALGPDGAVGHYHKLHLFDALGWRESDALRPGELDEQALLVVPVGEFAVGVATCYDLRFPEIFRALVDQGATAFAVPAAWVGGPLKEEHWVTLLRARAIENTCYLVAASQPPPVCAGHSAVIDPMGVMLAGLGETEGIVVADLETSRLDAVRALLPVLEHRRYEVRAHT